LANGQRESAIVQIGAALGVVSNTANLSNTNGRGVTGKDE